MENENPKVGYIKLQLESNCTNTETNILQEYWEIVDGKFAIKDTNILLEKYNYTRGELTKLTKSKSKLLVFVFCKNCNSYELKEVCSRTEYQECLRTYEYIHYTRQEKICDYCQTIKQEERRKRQEAENKHKKIEEEKRKKLQEIEDRRKKEEERTRLNKAIEDKKWQLLSDFEKDVLCRCLQANFHDVRRFFVQKRGQKSDVFINAIRELELLDLITIRRDYEGNIRGHNFLPKLKEFKDEIETSIVVIKEQQNKIERNSTNSLKFKLTINDISNNPYRPKFAGVITFKEEIVLHPNIEYTFGAWERENENLYLTLIPTEDLERIPTQNKVSNKPEHIQKIILDNFNNLGKNIFEDNF